jgi:protein-S-isoprenylcysteine O-methyltransferase Ste14
MYSGVLLMCLALPLALGSYWALLSAVLILPVLAARIQGEERLLLSQLDGYAQYRSQTRFRLIPGVW